MMCVNIKWKMYMILSMDTNAQYHARRTHNLHGEAVLCGEYKYCGGSRESPQEEAECRDCLLRCVEHSFRQYGVESTIRNERKEDPDNRGR